MQADHGGHCRVICARLARLTEAFQKAAATPVTVDQQKTEGLQKRADANARLLGPNPK
jgi:hypothetical protein